MYFTSNQITVSPESVVGEDRIQFRDTTFVVECWPGSAALENFEFRVTDVVRTDDQKELNPEWWDVSTVGDFGKFKAVLVKFKGAGFSQLISTDAGPADLTLYETFIRGGRITLVVELLGVPDDVTRTDNFVLTLNYGPPRSSN